MQARFGLVSAPNSPLPHAFGAPWHHRVLFFSSPHHMILMPSRCSNCGYKMRKNSRFASYCITIRLLQLSLARHLTQIVPSYSVGQFPNIIPKSFAILSTTRERARTHVLLLSRLMWRDVKVEYVHRQTHRRTRVWNIDNTSNVALDWSA